MIDDRGNSLSESGAGDCAMGMTKVLTETAPMSRTVRTALENMMMESVAREEQITTAPDLRL